MPDKTYADGFKDGIEEAAYAADDAARIWEPEPNKPDPVEVAVSRALRMLAHEIRQIKPEPPRPSALIEKEEA